MSRPVGAKGQVEDAAMTFDEIAERMGISRKMAWLHYKRAIEKIRRRPDALRALLITVAFRQQLESRRLSSGLGAEQ